MKIPTFDSKNKQSLTIFRINFEVAIAFAVLINFLEFSCAERDRVPTESTVVIDMPVVFSLARVIIRSAFRQRPAISLSVEFCDFREQQAKCFERPDTSQRNIEEVKPKALMSIDNR